MSNIYIQEPPTNGKVLLHTTVGDIDIELWSKEAPKACRNFVQLCLENYYNGTIFHRVIKGFIAQGGDPKGDGTGGESIYGKPFRDEFHSRLRFVRRGLVAMANAGKDDNGSQFFFTLGSCPDLQNKHTIFGKVAGDTLYNMLKLEDCVVDKDDRPIYPHKILSAKVLSNPFPDIVPRSSGEKISEEKEKPKEKGEKNFKLLSFGDEAEEEEMAADNVAQTFRGKSKSSHDLANDPKLSSVSVSELYDQEDVGLAKKKALENVRKKLKVSDSEKGEKQVEADKKPGINIKMAVKDDKPKSDPEEKASDREEIKRQIKELTKELKKKPSQQEPVEERSSGSGKMPKHGSGNPLLDEYHQQQDFYSSKKKALSLDKDEREKMTLLMLEKFKEKVQDALENTYGSDDDDDSGEGWLSHRLEFGEREVLAKDANMPAEDRYDITDPRNPINQRRRGEKRGRERRH